MGTAVPSDFTGKVGIVTGGAGFVGRRLCEMLAERGAAKVIGLGLSAPGTQQWAPTHPSHSVIEFRVCDVTDADAVNAAFEAADCVWHTAALVGPFHPRHAYDAVNYHGTLHVIEACKRHGVPKMIYSGSPSTRFDGSDVSGKTEAELSIRPPGQFLEPYAESKAKGEVACREANDSDVPFLTVTIAPHQVYGPRDPIFLPNMMEAAKVGKLRVFGPGKNCISMVHVDNYCHGLILGYHALGRPDAVERVAGQFIVVTDGGRVVLWEALDRAAVHLGYGSLLAKWHLPRTLLMAVAHVGRLISYVTGRSFKLTPFVVKMLVIDRWFDISKARDVLRYEPLISFEEGWQSTLNWFKNNASFLDACAERTKDNKVFEKPKQVK